MPHLNHSWNACRVEGRWVMIDTCWSAGYWESSYVADFSPAYFAADPYYFRLQHVPMEVVDVVSVAAKQKAKQAPVARRGTLFLRPEHEELPTLPVDRKHLKKLMTLGKPAYDDPDAPVLAPDNPGEGPLPVGRVFLEAGVKVLSPRTLGYTWRVDKPIQVLELEASEEIQFRCSVEHVSRELLHCCWAVSYSEDPDSSKKKRRRVELKFALPHRGTYLVSVTCHPEGASHARLSVCDFVFEASKGLEDTHDPASHFCGFLENLRPRHRHVDPEHFRLVSPLEGYIRPELAVGFVIDAPLEVNWMMVANNGNWLVLDKLGHHKQQLQRVYAKNEPLSFASSGPANGKEEKEEEEEAHARATIKFAPPAVNKGKFTRFAGRLRMSEFPDLQIFFTSRLDSSPTLLYSFRAGHRDPLHMRPGRVIMNAYGRVAASGVRIAAVTVKHTHIYVYMYVCIIL